MEATELAEATASRDPIVGLRAVASLRALLESLEELQVAKRARAGLVLAADRRPARRQPPGRAQEARPARAAATQGALMFERFTSEARAVVVEAQEECRRLGGGAIGTEHLLLGLWVEEGTPAVRALEGLGVAARGAASRGGRRHAAGRRGAPDARHRPRGGAATSRGRIRAGRPRTDARFALVRGARAASRSRPPRSAPSSSRCALARARPSLDRRRARPARDRRGRRPPVKRLLTDQGVDPGSVRQAVLAEL